MMPTERTKRFVGVLSATILVIGALLLAVHISHKSETSTKAISIMQSKVSTITKAARTMNPQQTTTTVTLFWTNSTFVNLNKDCAVYTDTMFLQAVLGTMQWGGITDTINVTAIACGSMTVYFSCGSTTQVKALSNCANLRSQLQVKGVGLNNILLVTLPDIFNPDGTSNNGIYALYTLILLPIFCCVGFLLWYRMKQQQADTQYLQDTATFSNVAGRTHVPYDPTATPMNYQAQMPPMYAQPPPMSAPPPMFVQPPMFAQPPMYAAPPPMAPMPQFVQPPYYQ
jgi:hypothetical protein